MKNEASGESIRLILSDVDGVLTDGGIVYDNEGVEQKRFHVRDGLGINLWQRAGHIFGILTARTSHIVQVRTAELGIHIVCQGFEDKLAKGREVIAELNLEPREVCFIGDDLPDLPLIREVGMGVAVADASPEVREVADYVTSCKGGKGAVREVVEMLLRAQQRWDDIVRPYTEA
ncbi:MAG TPA: phenylphosphate carboxylase subunit delta [Planctomycetes bacterium]|nr:phenylphosphate carboxylase subunit delta [Planctomycetaceae bacterium]HIM28034.1 phenylphosphate carboxylase subunit delta [Planctomycetota bacterium]